MSARAAANAAWQAYLKAVNEGGDLAAAADVMQAASKALATEIRAQHPLSSPSLTSTTCALCGDKDYGNGIPTHRPSCPVLKEERGRELE